MVSSGMLWARKSCQVLYCSNVSQSRDWTVNNISHSETQIHSSYNTETDNIQQTQALRVCVFKSGCVCQYMSVCVWRYTWLTEDIEDRVLAEHHQIANHHMTHQLLQLKKRKQREMEGVRWEGWRRKILCSTAYFCVSVVELPVLNQWQLQSCWVALRCAMSHLGTTERGGRYQQSNGGMLECVGWMSVFFM